MQQDEQRTGSRTRFKTLPFLWKELRRFILIFFIASFGIFLALESMPEDPISLRVKNPDPERIAEIRESLGLNDPWYQRYVRGIGDFVQLDWGESLISGRPVRSEVGRFLPATLELAIPGIIFGAGLGIAVVLLAHATGWRWLLQPVRGLSALGLTVPIFWIGLILILLFSVRFGWLPVGGRFDFAHVAPEGSGFLLIDSLVQGDAEAFWISLRHLVLPVLTLSLYPAAVVAGTLEARLNQSSIQRLVTALEARGFSKLRIWGRHVLRLVSGPVVTVIGTQAGALLGGAVLTETVYSWPGMGRFIVDGVTLSDLLARRLDYQLNTKENAGEG
jgi:dipeptide transport system permease protein